MKIKFWGTRGSFPTPHADKVIYGGNTSCVEVTTPDNDMIILDMGTGLIDLGNDLFKRQDPPTDITILLSHYHWDHMIGFLGFNPLFDPRFSFKIYGKKDRLDLDTIIEKALDDTFWPISREMFQARLETSFFPEDSLYINEKICVESALHGHPNGTNSYKITYSGKSVMYTTDCEHPVEHLNPTLAKFGKGVDTLIHDAQYTDDELKERIGWGHSSYMQAIEFAKLIDAKRLVLFHHDPMRSDTELKQIEEDASKHFPNLICAKQGMEIEL